ncbi:hypothetical protein KP509_17G054300 [Ceratopteris richardii]|uniref:Glycosyltransferase STELLO1 n=1 Tax=Ceratopteris richardii TaxID=49495 RepID=A0A8T2SXX6_CERRI|nr:hypothetical protein KP509_17G054300 [Ceratopteris richardii]KAH7373408.1 hypothetical protein KP509_17G054300 [Ceratopteris richardii]KAH7373409.1 hypothetical protein KP509_17G054300 [Ceratopteris richardii]
MLVQQERSELPDSVKHKNEDDDEEEEANYNDETALLPSESNQQQKDSGKWDKLTDHFPKIAIFSLLCLSALILILVRSRSETGAILCIESQLSKEAEGIPYPSVNFRTVKRLGADTTIFSTVHSENWIVIAVSGYPTEEIHEYTKLKGWRVLAVGGYDTPSDWNVSGVIYLSPQQQAALPYRIVRHLPERSFVRKSVGYLFAIQHGAVRIYDADENASVLGDDLNKAFDLHLNGENSRRETILQYLSIENRTCVNPYIHFGQPSVWPRGLPLSLVGKINPEIAYGQVFSGNQFIQQGLANGLPDVDSIFYRTRKSGIKPYVIIFDQNAPPVALPPGTMAPVNSLNTLFHSTAFWSLMLPISVSPMASDIMRGYWAQRLLWEIGGHLTIHPPSVHRIDKIAPHSYADEKDIHKNVDRLTQFLVSWRTRKSSILDKALHLSHSMAEAGFWTAQDVVYTAAWLQDLISIGYAVPRSLALDLGRGTTLVHQEDHKSFTPIKLPSVHLGVEEATFTGTEVENLMRWRKFYVNIVLILECRWPLNHTALAWKMLYGRMFKSVSMLSAHRDEEFGVEESDSEHSYKSLPAIFEKFPNAEGFLFLKDDVILNYWTLLTADKSRLWNLYKITNSWLHVNFYKEGPLWYHKSGVRKAVQAMISDLPSPYKATYRSNIDRSHYVVCRSNVFYVPHQHVEGFSKLTSLAVKKNLRHEVAVPLILYALEFKDRFDISAFSEVIYKPSDAESAADYYSTRANAVYPWYAKNEVELQRIIKAMSGGDHLLLRYVQ